MLTPDIAIENYFRAWNEQDAQRRLELVEQAWGDDAIYIDASNSANGRAAVAEMIGAVIGSIPGGRFERTSPIDAHHNVVRFNWAIKAPDGATLIEGVDFGDLDEDGRLRRITGFFAETPPAVEAKAGNVIEVSRDVAAPRDLVWELISDHRLYGELAPNLTDVRVVSGTGVGMVRQCSNFEGQTWTETCLDWQEEEGYTFQVDASTYPYPLDKMVATWSVKELGDSSRIKMRFDYEPSQGEAARAFLPQFRAAFPQILEAILDRWQHEAEGRMAGASAAR